MAISPYHPVDEFLFCIAGIPEDEMVEPMELFVEKLAATREWHPEPPEFVNGTEDLGDGELLYTVGGLLRIYSSRPPAVLDAEIDQAQFEQVFDIVSAVIEFSRAYKVDIEFVLQGDTVGFVENGEMDDWLLNRFLTPWKESIERRK